MVLKIPTIQQAPPQHVTRIDAPVLPLTHEIPIYPGQAYNAPTGPNLIGSDYDESIANIFCFGAFADKNSGIVYHNLTGSFPHVVQWECLLLHTILLQPKLHSGNTNFRHR
jgi:hypothetical protein